MVEEFATLALAKGLTDEALTEVIDSATRDAVGLVAQSLRDRGPEMLREHAAIQSGFEDRLAARWRRALDVFEMVHVACFEAGETYHQRPWPEGEDAIAKAQAMTLVHARACLERNPTEPGGGSRRGSLTAVLLVVAIGAAILIGGVEVGHHTGPVTIRLEAGAWFLCSPPSWPLRPVPIGPDRSPAGRKRFAGEPLPLSWVSSPASPSALRA
jgi:hypothetical protein